ncbi:MAG: hypothetical protein AAGN66_08100 [Acidobacteriota bacterium]
MTASSLRTFRASFLEVLRGQRPLMVGAGVLGFVPLVIPFVPGIGPHRGDEIRLAMAAVLVVLGGGLYLLGLGATLFGRDLGEGRLSFYLVRPATTWGLWLGRVTAGWVAALLVITALVLPTLWVDAESILPRLGGVGVTGTQSAVMPLMAPTDFLYGLGLLEQAPVGRLAAPLRFAGLGLAVLAVLLAAHAVSTWVRSRSPWLLLDLVGALAAGGLLSATRTTLLGDQGWGAMVVLQRLAIPAAAAVLLVAGGLQLSRGRSHLVRGHGVSSGVVWGAGVVLALAAFSYGRWVVTPSLEDLRSLGSVRAGVGGQVLFVGGEAAGRAGFQAAFAVDLERGDSELLGGLGPVDRWLTFSDNGAVAVWARCRRLYPSDCRLWRRTRTDPGASHPTPVTFSRSDSRIRLSPSGDLVALWSFSHIEVQHLHSGQQLASLRASYPVEMSFPSPGTVRSYEENDDGFLQIRELDLTSPRFTEAGRIEGLGPVRTPPGRADVVISRTLFPARYALFHGRDGTLIRDLSPPELGFGDGARFTADGRLLVLHHPGPGTAGGGPAALAIYDDPLAEDAAPRVVKLPFVEEVVLGPEVAPGRLRLGLRFTRGTGEQMAPSLEAPDLGPSLEALGLAPSPEWSTYEMDLATGQLMGAGRGARPLLTEAPTPGPGSAASRLLRVAGGGIVELGADGELRKVLAIPR